MQKEEVEQKPLSGMRIGVVRELMIKPGKNDEAIRSTTKSRPGCETLLGAELVESVDPLYPDDPQITNMTYTFQDAFAEVIAHNMPEYFWQKDDNGELELVVPGGT